MTFEVYEKAFRKKASKSGYSEEDVLKCLEYAKPLIERNLPVIYNTANLSALVGYKKGYLKRAALFTRYFYRTFQIKKQNGKFRKISEPLPSLKEIQIWILQNILYEIPISKFAKAYIPNRNIIDNVRFHKNKDKVVCLDIENFFSSVERSSVETIFRNCGYSSNVANLLGKLCTCNDILPQGAPTSPYLSNIYLREFDELVANYCLNRNIRFTRYADDLAFSGDFDEMELINFTKAGLTQIKLNLNPDKIKVMLRNDQQIITGIVVNKKLQTPKDQRNEIRKEVYFVKKFGLSEHLIRTKNKRANYIKHLLGKINYAIYVNPKDEELKRAKTFLYETYVKNFDDKVK